MSAIKTFTYSVRATEEQREKWEAAAVAHGRMTVGAFLAQATDTYIEKMAKSGRRLPLAWTEGIFYARVHDMWYQYQDAEVRGIVSGRFGIFRGTRSGQHPGQDHCYSLVHLPSKRIIAVLTYQRDCKAFAAELTYLWVNWDQSDPEEVIKTSPQLPTIQALYRKYTANDPQ